MGMYPYENNLDVNWLEICGLNIFSTEWVNLLEQSCYRLEQSLIESAQICVLQISTGPVIVVSHLWAALKFEECQYGLKKVSNCTSYEVEATPSIISQAISLVDPDWIRFINRLYKILGISTSISPVLNTSEY